LKATGGNQSEGKNQQRQEEKIGAEIQAQAEDKTSENRQPEIISA
jgi:hypothetical protein